MLSTPIAVVAHSSREKRAERLANVIDAEFVTTDDGTLGPGRNHDEAWRWLADSGGRWSVVLEDDAIPIKGFRDQLHHVLKAAPSPIVSLYLGRGRPQHWQPHIMRVVASDAHFLMCSSLLHHVGVAIKTAYVPHMLDTRDQDLPVDESISEWAKRRRLPVAYTHPSIIDHDNRLSTTIMVRQSGFSGETGERVELRKAWAFGKRKAWVPSTARIPEPDI